MAENHIEFLLKRVKGDKRTDTICREFWETMLPNKVTEHLQDHLTFETQYSEISALVSDLILVIPVFKMFPNREHLDVVDVGSGKGNLGDMIVAINEINRNQIGKSYSSSQVYNHINEVMRKTDVFSNVQINFLNTDVYDWRSNGAGNKVAFRLQKSPFDIPVDDSSQDIAITKWCFHHMERDQMLEQTKNLFRVLKPNGISVVIEAFMTREKSLPEYTGGLSTTFEKQLENSHKQLSFIDIWPEGSWKDDCIDISETYLRLSRDEQHAILSFEDYFGHYVLNQRQTMPFPFTYIEAEELVNMFKEVGFIHEVHNFLMIGRGL